MTGLLFHNLCSQWHASICLQPQLRGSVSLGRLPCPVELIRSHCVCSSPVDLTCQFSPQAQMKNSNKAGVKFCLPYLEQKSSAGQEGMPCLQTLKHVHVVRHACLSERRTPASACIHPHPVPLAPAPVHSTICRSKLSVF